MRIILALLVLLCSVSSNANAGGATFGIMDFGSVQVNNNDTLNRTIGWLFDLNSDVVVNGLGIWDEGIDGLQDDHLTGIFDANGNLLASASVLSGTQSQAEGLVIGNGQFRYADIPDLTLVAGEEYVIAALYNNNDVFESDASFVTTSSQVNFLEERFSLVNDGFVFPVGTFDRNALFGPNFRISAVPEPSSTLMILSVAVVLVRRNRRYE